MFSPSSGTQLPKPDERERTVAVLQYSPEGDFTGAVMPMAVPLDTTSQWRGLLHGMLRHLATTEPETRLDGLYTFTWWTGETEAKDSGLILTRVSEGLVSEDLLNRPLPKDTLGLMLVHAGSKNDMRSAVLALRGYITNEGVSRPDRYLAVLFNPQGSVFDARIDAQARTSTRLLSRFLLQALDRDLEQRR